MSLPSPFQEALGSSSRSGKELETPTSPFSMKNERLLSRGESMPSWQMNQSVVMLAGMPRWFLHSLHHNTEGMVTLEGA